MSQNQSTQVTAPRAERPATASPATLVPPVDIVEDEGGITLTADLPGVSRERLDVRVEGGHLLIEAEVAVPVPEQLSVVYAEVRGAHYRRSFALSNELDSAHVEANLKDGVLTLRVPRTEKAKPRRIEVQVS